jgi:hypothetical protein
MKVIHGFIQIHPDPLASDKRKAGGILYPSGPGLASTCRRSHHHTPPWGHPYRWSTWTVRLHFFIPQRGGSSPRDEPASTRIPRTPTGVRLDRTEHVTFISHTLLRGSAATCRAVPSPCFRTPSGVFRSSAAPCTGSYHTPPGGQTGRIGRVMFISHTLGRLQQFTVPHVFVPPAGRPAVCRMIEGIVWYQGKVESPPDRRRAADQPDFSLSLATTCSA